MRYFLKIAYNGKNYNGWQIQNNAPSVQEKLSHCISIQLKEKVRTIGSSRTDTGVHCKEQYIHFDTEKEIIKKDFLHKINAFLPDDIYIADIQAVNDLAHARFSVLSRSYQYHITLNKNPFYLDLSYRIMYKPNIDAMNRAALLLLKYKDFEAFCKSNSYNKHFLCNVIEAKWEMKNDFLIFYIKANRFLRGMVRLITGALLNVGLGKISIEEFENILKKKGKFKTIYSVPAQGLFLYEVKYHKGVYDLNYG